MKPTQVRVVIRQKLSVGCYENIEPEVEICAELEPGDDPAKCLSQLHQSVQAAWAKQALTELAWVAQRRKLDKEEKKFFEYTNVTNSTRSQLKGLL